MGYPTRARSVSSKGRPESSTSRTPPIGGSYYVSLTQGQVHRIAYESTNHAPVARATANPDHGAVPLQVQLSASTSSDADPGDQLTYAWDLDADGQFDDSTSVNPTKTYTTEVSIDRASE